MTTPLLEVRNLVTSFLGEGGVARAVDDVSFTLMPGRVLGIVGESGCGKSVTSLSLMRLLPRPAGRIDGGEVLFKGEDIMKMPASRLHKIRGNSMSMIFQEPMTALNPVHKIKRQVGEVFELHYPTMTNVEIHKASLAILEKVGIPAPERRLEEYPHQLSGGMRQRVMIAIALACKPDILIADEPTTALDVTIQAQILELMRDIQKETGMAIIFITHDLGVIAEMCHEVLVMYGGQIVERADVDALFANPMHPYTQGLLRSIPRLDGVRKQKLPTIDGMVPGLLDFPPGCRFQNRCPAAIESCSRVAPRVEALSGDREVRCHLVTKSKTEKQGAT